jgi:hypothetical protein
MSFFTRITNPSENQVKIPIHLIQSLISELDRNRISLSTIVTVLDLSADEQLDFNTFLDKVASAPDKVKFSNRIFNYLVLGEMGMIEDRDYLNETLFWAAVDREAAG